jgi:hypothetical protein
MKIGICFLTVKPSKAFYDFCKQLNSDKYTVYICIDDNNYKIDTDDKSVTIIKINKRLCENAGFKGSVAYFSDYTACSRDKALYYFCRVNCNSHRQIWFIEEDVLIPTLQTISNIDDKYPLADLLCKDNTIKQDKAIIWNNPWHWQRIFKQTSLPPPYATSMICAIRVSRKLLYYINKYVVIYKKLFLDEAFFTTMALKAQLRVRTPSELSSIVFRKDWKDEDISPTNLYHPMKSIERQMTLRNRFLVIGNT